MPKVPKVPRVPEVPGVRRLPTVPKAHPWHRSTFGTLGTFGTYNLGVKIYTRTGDRGETALLDGSRVLKSDSRVAAYGDVDELNAALGLARAQRIDPDLDEIVVHLQRDLFAIGSRLADPSDRLAERVTKVAVGQSDVERLEAWIDRLDAELPPLRRFILPGGAPAGALLHLARTICRRAERRIVALGSAGQPEVLAYINRLSDLLFVLARVANTRAGVAELEW